MTPSRDQIIEAVLAFVNAGSSAERKQIVETNRGVLLADAADEILADLLTQYRDNEDTTRVLEERRALLARCRHEGIDTAFRLATQEQLVKVVQIGEAVLAFLNAATWTESKQIVEKHRELLLTDAADAVLADLLEQYSDNANAIRRIEEHRALLARCRHEGIDAAFAERLRPPLGGYESELDVLLKELRQLTEPGDMPRAVAVCRAALELLSRDSQPELWAQLQVNLANKLAQNPLGERAQNLEEAIYHYQRALEVLTRQDFPEQWAALQYNLAGAYSDRIYAERAENLEEAIRHYKRALEVYTRQDFAERWAATHNNLGNAYRERIREDRAENLEEAIRLFRQALEVHTRQDFPEQWAMTHNNLGAAYSYRIREDRAENLEEAIYHYQRALEVLTRQDFPELWAMAHNNLGNVYSDRIREDWAENLEKAIYHYQQALEVRTLQGFPQDWAGTQHNLGNAYLQRIRENRAQNLERAIHHYQQALKIKTAKVFPEDCRNTAYALGNLLYDGGRFTEACKKFETAHEAVEALRGEVQREQARRTLAEENGVLYARLVHCCLLEGNEEAAFEYAVAGKGRAFVDLLATTRFDFFAAGADDPQLAEDLRQARELRQQIDNLWAQLLLGEGGTSAAEGTERRSPVHMHAELRALYARENDLWEEMSFEHPALSATQQAPALKAEEARKLAEELGATLVEYYQHAGGWCVFVVSPDGLRHVPLPAVNDELLVRMFRWMERLESGTGINKLKSSGPLRRLHEALIEPLRAHLPPGETVVLAPFAWLHLLPIGAALDPKTGRYAADDYKLALAPSLAALRVVRDQAQQQEEGATSHHEREPERLLSVAYPDRPESEGYLEHAVPEARAITGHFNRVTGLYEEAATPEAVITHAGGGQDVIHFSCHGLFDPDAPQQSGLLLSSGWLTVQRIIAEMRLERRTRLVTVSACVSGRAEVRRGEEHVGLLQALMSAGARAVVASLWSVDDASTRILFEAFYEKRAAGASPADALADAARLVRALPDREHPYYWAAFQASGLAHLPNNKPKAAHPLTGRATRRIADEPSTNSSTRGGFWAVNEMDMVQRSQHLLEEMSDDPEGVLAELGPVEGQKVVADLSALAEQAEEVQTEAALLELADAIHRLIEDTPALADLLLPEGMEVRKTITPSIHNAAYEKSQYAQEYAARVRNRLVEAHEELEQALRDLLSQGEERRSEGEGRR